MLELDITSLIGQDLWPCYGSIQTHGHNAAKITWNAALDLAKECEFVNEDNRDEMVEHFIQLGLSDSEEAEWTDQELNALVIQSICSDLTALGINLDTFSELSLKDLEKLLQDFEDNQDDYTPIFIGCLDKKLYIALN